MVAVTDTDNLEIIRGGLQRFGGRQKSAGEYQMVQCPFHSDNSPSCGVFLRRDDLYKPLGWFHCFGCGAHGEWNIFAEKTGLDQIKEWDSKEKRIEYNARAAEAELLGDSGLTLRSVLREMRCPEATKWPQYMDWRGVKGALIHKVGGMVINDDRSNGVALLFPIKIGNKIRGGVKALYTKREGETSYITMPGPWVRRYGAPILDVSTKIGLPKSSTGNFWEHGT